MEHPRPPLILDRRPLYPETVAVGVPRGTRTVLKRAAAAEQVSVSALVRRAIERLATEACTRSPAHG